MAILLLFGLVGCATRPPAARQSVPGLTINDSVLRQWRFLYRRVASVEWMTCLYGRVEGRGVHVEESRLADVSRAAFAAVSGHCETRAGRTLIGIAHSHPPSPAGVPGCLPSPTDVQDLGRPWRIVVVVCDASDDAVRFGFRAEGRHAVMRALAVRERPEPLRRADAGR